MALQIEQFMCRSDNFGVLAHDPESGETAIIDAPEERPILAAIERTGWKPTMILTTHHHGDHVEANMALKERFGLTIIGPEAEAAKIPGIDRTVKDNDTFMFGKEEVRVISTPGLRRDTFAITFPNRMSPSPATRCSRSAAGGCSNASHRRCSIR